MAKLVPLTPSNAQVVQSSDSKIDLNVDSVVWEYTDWSGGEGLKKWSSENSNQYDLSYKVDALSVPGSLRLSKDVQTAGVNKTGTLVKAANKLFHFSSADDNVATFSGDVSGTTWDDKDVVGPGDTDYWGTRGDGDGKYIFMPLVGGDGDVYRIAPPETYSDAFPTPSKWVDEDNTNVVDRPLVKIGGSLYTIHLTGDQLIVMEYSANPNATPSVTGTAVFTAHEGNRDSAASVTHTSGGGNQGIVAKGDNELFICIRGKEGESILYRVVPGSALQETFGVEVARIPGFTVDCIWYASSVLLLAGSSNTSGATERVIYYVKGTEFGSFGLLRQDETFEEGSLIVSTDASRMDRTFFLAPTGSTSNSGTNTWTLFTIDLLTGAIFGGPEFPNLVDPNSLIDFKGHAFISENKGASSTQTYRTKSTYAASGSLITAVHDFDIADNKTLQAITIHTEPLPSGTSVQVHYQINQSGTWVDAGTEDTDNATSKTFTVSTDSSSVKFSNLQLKVTLATSTASNTPVVRAVQVRAIPSEYVKEWDLLIDVNDEDAQAQGQSLTGATLIDNIKSSAATENVLQFDNGYESSSAGTYDAHDVIIRQYQLQLDTPGQGSALVRVREIK